MIFRSSVRRQSDAIPPGILRAGICLAVVLSLSATCYAMPITYYGIDPAADPGDTLTNSDAAYANFLSATGPVSTIDFEGLSGTVPTSSPGRLLAPGVRATRTNMAVDIVGGGNRIVGYNTTSPGSRYARMSEQSLNSNAPPGSLNLAFDTPIDAFGAYFTGVGTQSSVLQLLFDDGTSQTETIAGDQDGGALFFGFTSFGNSISEVSISVNTTGNIRDVFGVDDISFRAAQPVPEPASLAIWSLVGAASLVAARRRRIAAKGST